MMVPSNGPVLSTVFVDYDNIYLSLKRKSDEAAKRFAKDSALWLRAIENGSLITSTNGMEFSGQRRIVMNRCYGNPVPRRNSSDNSTDMNSFPFVRHHFLRSGFEVIDCPPLTAQLKNSADIRMVMDIRDYLGHDTYFNEFIIMSGDADFTPLLHRLRAHARRTIVYANDHTAQPYTAISDGEIRESDLLTLLMEGSLDATQDASNTLTSQPALPSSAQIETMRRGILAEVVSLVRSAGQPVPLEALADRAIRSLGHDKTVGSSWGGAGGFRDLLLKGLPEGIRLSDQPPYYVFDASWQIAAPPASKPEVRTNLPPAPTPQLSRHEFEAERPQIAAPTPPPARFEPAPTAARYEPAPGQRPAQPQVNFGTPPLPYQPAALAAYEPPAASAPVRQAPPPPAQQPAAAAQPKAAPPAPARTNPGASAIQTSITRIHEACQAPPLSPPEYRAIFEVMAQEINANNLSGSQTLVNIAQRALELGVEVRRDDIRFILEVVSESDPWFEQGASASLFASRFRNFVIARCRSQGLNLSADELDLIDAWFGGSPIAAKTAPAQQTSPRSPSIPASPAAQNSGPRRSLVESR